MKTIVMVAVVGIAASGCLRFGGDGDLDLGVQDGGDVLDTEEVEAFDRGSEPMVVAQQMATLADSFFAFDPTIDPAADAPTNAARIQSRMRDQLSGGDGGAGCGMVTLVGTTVTVDFGAGCKLPGGITVSGAASAAVQKSGATITVLLTFTALKVNTKALAGTASFATSTGSSFTLNANLTSGGITLTATDLVLSGIPGATIIMDGVLAAKQGGANTTLTFHMVKWKLGDCYPNTGNMQVKWGLLQQTLIFDAQTPQTGMVTVKIGKKTAKRSLPTYPGCPPSAPAI